MALNDGVLCEPATAAPAVQPTHRHGLAIAAVSAAALIWSPSSAVTKGTLPRIPPMTVGAIRFTVAAAILAIAVRSRTDTRLPTVRQRLHIGAAGLLGISAYF